MYTVTEPIGSAVPKFSLNTDGLRMVKSMGASMSLGCPAQSYPPPSFRFVCVFVVKTLSLLYQHIAFFLYFDRSTNILHISISFSAKGGLISDSGKHKLKISTFQSLLVDPFQNFLDLQF